MFDLNAIVSAALNAAIQAATEPLVTRITALESVCATQHEGMVAMRDRIAALETNETYLTNRIAALENNPAQGVDTQATPATITADAFVTHLDNQEWFWEKLQNRIDAATEAALDNHCNVYDHDDYDNTVSAFEDMPSLDDYVTRDEVRSEIEDVLNNATLSLSI